MVFMRTFVIGGSGHVGALVVPRLAALGHALTLFDLRAPDYPVPGGSRVVVGDLLDDSALQNALVPTNGSAHDALLYLAMGGTVRGDRAATTKNAYDVNGRGVWLACQTGAEAGVGRFVLASSLSVYEECFTRALPSEAEPPDAVSLYGLTKSFGEQTLAAWTRRPTKPQIVSGVALRLCLPVPDAAEVRARHETGRGDCALTADETARALDAALTLSPHAGFDAVHLAGGEAARTGRVNVAKAKTLLGWEPDTLAAFA